MARVGRRRRSPGRILRPAFELLLLGISLLAGLGVVGGCVVASGGDFGGEEGVAFVGGLVIAIILVGTVFLFTSMSRDLRLLRDRLDRDTVARDEDPKPLS